MKKIFVQLIILGLFTVFSGVALANGFYASTNELGYQGTIWNITDSTGPWTTSTPRNANLYTVHGIQGNDNYNVLMSSWFEHVPSNQNDSFLQIAEGIGYGNTLSITSAIGGWDAALKKFTVTVTGQNSPYPYSRFWQPDNGVAWGVTFTNYTYTFTATFDSEAVYDDGFLVNAVDPVEIIGSFAGQFVVTQDVNKNPIVDGDTYGFSITFSNGLFDDEISGEITNAFGEKVPEPATVLLLGLGLIGIAGIRRRI